MVHRDIKPANVLVDGRGHLWVTDFGLAQFQQGGGLTMTGDLLGTLRYMSPEQALAHRVAVDHRTDIYSLGATLYELLALEPPFAGTDRQELLRQIAFEEPRAPRRLNPAIPADLETIVFKALAKNPDERYATAQELADDLRRFLEDKPIRARRPTLAQKIKKWCRRHPGVVWTAALSVLLLLACTAAELAVNNSLIQQEQKKTGTALDKAEAAEKELALSLYYETIARVAREHDTGNVGLAERLLDSDRCPAHLRGWEWHYLKRLRYGRPPVIRLAPQVQHVAVNPDGHRLATPDFQAVHIWDARTGRLLHDLPASGTGGSFPAFSADGRFLAVPGGRGMIVLWDTETWMSIRTLVATREQHPVAKVHETRNKVDEVRLAYSPDGHHIAAGDDQGTITLWDMGTGAPPRTLAKHAGEITSLAFSPDSQRLASTGDDGTVQLWDVASGEPLYPLPPFPTAVGQAVFSPDGRYLAVATGDLYWVGDHGDVYLLDAASGEVVRTLRGHRGAVFSVAFTPDGKRLASACTEDKTIKLWDVETGKEALTLRGHVDGPQYVAFSPDGKRLYSVAMDRQLLTWDATPLENQPRAAYRSLPSHAARITGVVFSPDDHYLASGSLDGKVKLWDARSWQEIRTLQNEDHVQHLAFSPDARCLAAISSFSVGGGVVKLWAMPSGEELRSIACPCRKEGGPPLGLAFSPDGRWLASPEGWGKDLFVYEAATARLVETFLGPDEFWIISTLAFHPGGRLFVTGHVDGNVSVFEVTPGADVAALCCALPGPNVANALGRAWRLTSAHRATHSFAAHTGRIIEAAFSPDGKWLATSGGGDETVKIWDVETWNPRPRSTLKTHLGGAYGIAFSRDGKQLATGGADAVVRIWDWNEGEPKERLALTQVAAQYGCITTR